MVALNKNTKIKWAVVLMAAVLVVPGFLKSEAVDALSRACQNSPACMKAVADEEAANRNAIAANNTANAYEQKRREFDAQIAELQRKMAESEAEMRELNAEIDAKIKQLEDDQDVLIELLVYIHLQGDEEPIQILAGADTISDLMNDQMRNEIVQDEINEMIKQIKADKAKLEEDKAQVEAELTRQEQQREELARVRQEQQDMIEKYKNDAEAYAAAAKQAQEAQRAAEKAEQEAHPELYRGSAYTGANTYPWQADCPGRQDEYVTYWEDAYGVHHLGGLVCECVSYVGWKAYEQYGIVASWGNAYSWDDMARAYGYRVDNTPEAGSIGQVDGYPYGHVFWVESVNGDGSINVTEYNNSYATYLYSGSSHFGDFGSRKISASELWQYNFIHLQ